MEVALIAFNYEERDVSLPMECQRHCITRKIEKS